MPSRRRFLKLSAAAALGAAALPGPAHGVTADGTTNGARRPAGRSLRILILGGTGFIGPHVVKTVLERGHVPTLFNRGRTVPRMYAELFADLENLVGDRDGDIAALAGRRWDAVIDDSGYTPEQVRATVQLLHDGVGQYLFTSTRGVYAGFTTTPLDEDAPLGMAGVPPSEWTGYGPLKALAEREVLAAFPSAATIVRPAIITGPGDNTDRFTYWYVRIDDGGAVLAPGDPSDPVQYTDVRDLAEFYVHLLEQRTAGTFNLLGPAAPLSSAALLHGIRATTAAPVAFHWVDWDTLDALGIREGRELSAWRAPRGENLNYGRVDNRRAIAAGLRFRPLADTARETRDWWRAQRLERLRAGIPTDLEQRALAAVRGPG